MKKIYPLLTVLLFAIVSCNNDSRISESSSVKSEHALNTASANDCSNFLRGKNFNSVKARIEFNYDGNAYVYSNSNNSVVFAGYIEIGESRGNSRYVRIHDSTGGAQFLNLLLSDDGKLTDQSDYTVYELPNNDEHIDPAVKAAMEADSMQPATKSPAKESTSQNENVKLFTGTKKFCDDQGDWYYVVTVEDNKITLKSFAGNNNTAYQDKSLPKNIIKGEITADNIILTKNEEGQMVELYRYKNGNLYESGYEGGQSVFHECK